MHYLNEPSLLVFPPNLISVTPTKIRESKIDPQYGDNKHKWAHSSVYQNGTTIKGKVFVTSVPSHNSQFLDIGSP